MTSHQSEEVDLRRCSGSSSARSPRNETPQQWHSLPVHAELLTTFDVFSLIANKMIGSGIYNNASAVLVLTGDKGLAMTLWVLGFVYTLIRCVLIIPITTQELTLYLQHGNLLGVLGCHAIYRRRTRLCMTTPSALVMWLFTTPHLIF
jgi:hypothetical protein